MTFQWAFHRDNLRREQCRSKWNLLANGSQQNAQNKAYSCLKTNCLGKWKEFHAEKRISILLTGSIVVFALRMSWQNGVFWPQGSLLFGVQKFSLQDCPKILLHLLPGPSRRLAPVIKCNAFLCFQSYSVRDISLTEIYRWLVTFGSVRWDTSLVQKFEIGPNNCNHVNINSISLHTEWIYHLLINEIPVYCKILLQYSS